MIISVFGPDGVGKSTVTSALADLGWCVFSGTGVASWPDQTWHRELTKAGIDETVIGTEEHLFEKIKRAHAMARELEKSHDVVVIDSDPLFKTLMHNYAHALPDPKNAQLILEQRDSLLQAIADYPTDNSRIHIYMQVSDTQDDLAQAKTLQKRIHARGTLAPFDPTSIRKSLDHLKACKAIRDLLIKKGQKVLTITSNRPFDVYSFQDELSSLNT